MIEASAYNPSMQRKPGSLVLGIFMHRGVNLICLAAFRYLTAFQLLTTLLATLISHLYLWPPLSGAAFFYVNSLPMNRINFIGSL
jgi:hypothetical protein